VRAKRRRERPLTGSLRVPGDKSISHRALIIAALAPGRSVITNLNTGADVRSTAAALGQLGTAVEIHEGDPIRGKGDDRISRAVVEGSGRAGLTEAETVIDVGNSGTSIRTLLGIAASMPGLTVLTGDASIRRRPMLRVVVPLRQMGAVIDGRNNGDLAPLSVRGADLTACDHELSIASAQVKTAILLAGLAAEGTTSVIEPGPSRDHTERMLAAAGADIHVDGRTVAVTGGVDLRPGDREVPGDVSSAMFLIAAALLVPDSDLTLENVGLNPTRTAALEVLESMGADIEVTPTGGDDEPVGTIRARHSALRGTTIEGEIVPRLIDEIPVLAALATQAEGTTEIRGARELRVKESDRIAALATGLSTLGATVEERPDGLSLEGPVAISGGEVESHGDHRIAMSFAVVGLVAEANVKVRGWSCVDTSFPEFLDLLGEAQRSR
jgi:3-phosphoshikimate 1-carboxyvinyltransferase